MTNLLETHDVQASTAQRQYVHVNHVLHLVGANCDRMVQDVCASRSGGAMFAQREARIVLNNRDARACGCVL